MLKRRFWGIFYIFLNIFFALNGKNYGGSFVEFLKKLDNKEAISIFINKITFKSDIPFSKEEFFYLTDLRENSFLTSQDIDRACSFLNNKKKFDKIDVDLIENPEENTKNLIFKLSSFWTFKKLILENILLNKQQYINLYSQQPGDQFDISLHEESIKNIKEYLHDKGCFNCSVKDELFYNKKSKNITVKLRIKKRDSFKVNKIDFDFICENKDSKELSSQEIFEFKEKLGKKIGSSLLNKIYLKQSLEKQVERIKKFFRKHGFLSSRVILKKIINKNKKILNLVFQINLGVRKILKFQGNKVFDEKFIKNNFIGADYPEWLYIPEILSEHILYEYKQRGYPDVTVDCTVGANKDFIFNIKEGEPLIIKDIKIINILDNTVLYNTSFFSDLLNNKIFNETDFNRCLEELRKFYLSNGYWDFKYISKKIISNQLLINIDKGTQKFLTSLKVEKFSDITQDDFFKKFINFKKKLLIPFNINWISEQKSFLINYFQNKSYWYVDVQPEFKVKNRLNQKAQDPKEQDVELTWKIKSGPKIKFGKVLLRGDTCLPFNKILKELSFKESDVWDSKKIETTRKRLKKLDIFKQIQIQPYKIYKNKDKSNQMVLLNLIDDEQVQARVRAGYFLTSKNFLFKRESTLKFGTSLIVKNPTNQADKLSINADVTKFEQKFDVDYQLPSPFGLRFQDSFCMGKFKGYGSRYVHPVKIRNSDSAYEALQSGFLFGLGNEYSKGHYWGINLGNEWIKTYRVRGNLNFSKNLENKMLPYLYLEPTLIFNKLNDNINVKKGSLTYLSLKFMVPENKGDVSAKLMLEESLFYPVYKEIILACRARVGYFFRRKFNNIQPVERFYLGGPFSVRGYELDSIPPWGVQEVINPDNTVKKIYTVQGGGSMFNGNLEVRFPIYKSFGGVIFQDFGVLSQSGVQGFASKWYPSSGFGLRYKIPIGSIRFDIGWKWKKRMPAPGDTGYAWYLTLGEAF